MVNTNSRDLLNLITVKHNKNTYNKLNKVLNQAQKYIDKHGDILVCPLPSGVLDKENIIFRRITGKELTDEQRKKLIEITCTGDIRACLYNYYTTDFVKIYIGILKHITNFECDDVEFDEAGTLYIWWDFRTSNGTRLDNMSTDQVEKMDLSKYKSKILN